MCKGAGLIDVGWTGGINGIGATKTGASPNTEENITSSGHEGICEYGVCRIRILDSLPLLQRCVYPRLFLYSLFPICSDFGISCIISTAPLDSLGGIYMYPGFDCSPESMLGFWNGNSARSDTIQEASPYLYPTYMISGSIGDLQSGFQTITIK
jgi:hypothetical protein